MYGTFMNDKNWDKSIKCN